MNNVSQKEGDGGRLSLLKISNILPPAVASTFLFLSIGMKEAEVDEGKLVRGC
jgi:hypothetical protein